MPQPSLVLEATAYTPDQLVASLIASPTPQLALAGRSNVGKSSLVNALANRRKLAKVSATPGKTRSVNYYRVQPWNFWLVDLPGYGYAKASHKEREKWAKLLEHYLKDCKSLKALVLLVDSRLEPQSLDIELLDYARSLGLAIVPVLTKADKCKQREISARVAEWTQLSGKRPVVTSSASRRGMQELWQVLCREAGVVLQPEADGREDGMEDEAPANSGAAQAPAAPAADSQA